MKKPRNVVTFKDGHREDIVFYTKRNEREILFATKSGIYLYIDVCVPKGVSGLKQATKFNRISLGHFGGLSYNEDFTISDIHIDDRVPYEYTVYMNGECMRGDVLVPSNADDEEIRKAILEGMKIEYEEKE